MAYGARSLGMSTGLLTTGFLAGNVVRMFTIPGFGRLSRQIGPAAALATE